MDGLKHQVIHGLKWSAAAKLFTQLFSWVSTFYVIRLLTPEDYGLVALATVFFTLITLITNNGLINALVQRQVKDIERRSALFTVSLIANSILSGLIIFLASPIADFYDNQALVPVLLFLAIINPIMSLTVVPQATLQVNMQFKARAMVETAAGFASAITAFTLAHFGFGVWALLLASAVMMTSRALGMQIAAQARYRVTRHLSGLGDILGYALQVQLGSIVWFLYNRADTVIIAKGLGVDRAGVYNVASEIASIPMTKINAIINEVAFSAFAKSNHDPQAMERYLRYALRIMGVVTIPVFAGLSIIAEPLVLTVLGEKWREASTVILILAWVFPLRMQATVIGNFISAKGHARFALTNAIVTCIVLVGAISYGVGFGIKGAAFGWVIGFTISYLFIVLRTAARYQISLQAMFSWWPVAIIATVMWLAVYAGQRALAHYTTLESWQLLIVSIGLGAVVAGPFLLAGYWKDIRELLKK